MEHGSWKIDGGPKEEKSGSVLKRMKVEYRKWGPAWAVVPRIFVRIKKHYLKNLKKRVCYKIYSAKENPEGTRKSI